MDQPEKPGDRRQPPPPPPDLGPDQARREKIARIKKALQDGTYHVSNEDVARKLIEHMLEPEE